MGFDTRDNSNVFNPVALLAVNAFLALENPLRMAGRSFANVRGVVP